MVFEKKYGTQTFQNVHTGPIDFCAKWDILQTISFGRHTMKANSLNAMLVVGLLSALALSGCKDNSSSDSIDTTDSQNSSIAQSPAQSSNTRGGNSAAAQGSANAQQSLPPVLAQDPTLKISQTTTGERIVQSAPAVAPPAYYSPSSQDVQSALADVLVASVAKMADGPERNKFYQQQANVLQTLKVSQCGQAPVGQPVVCNISLGNKAMQIKLLLTNVGWAVVK